MSKCALLNLVRENLLKVTVDNDYTGGEPFTRRDEIQLVDPDGVPCATPRPPRYQNEDYAYRFITGARGQQVRQISRALTISLDFIDGWIARQLEQWMHERARLYMTPNMGRNTIFSWRPMAQHGVAFNDGSTATDLTGVYITDVEQPGGILLWDEEPRMFAQEAVDDDLSLFQTAGGAGAGFTRAIRNLVQPPYPESANEGPLAGNSGWDKFGTDSAQLTFSHKSGAFGHPLCPDALRVDYTDDASTNRFIVINSLWDDGSGDYGGIPLSGSGTGVLCVWLRGKFPDGASLSFGPQTDQKTVSLAGMVLPGWTPVPISVLSSLWTSATGDPDLCSVILSVKATNGEAGWFEVGPTCVNQTNGSFYPHGKYWVESTAYAGASFIDTSGNFEFPENGSAVVSFDIPDYYEEGTDTPMALHKVGLLGSDDFGLTLLRDNSTGRFFIQIRDESSGPTITHTSTAIPLGVLNFGGINTVALTWGVNLFSIYVNGDLLEAFDSSTTKIRLGTDVPMRVGSNLSTDGCYPCRILTARIDEGAMTAAEVGNLHVSLTDPIALAFSVVARGRVFRITNVPQTLRSSLGGSQILGNVQLQQVEYQQVYADPLANREESVP